MFGLINLNKPAGWTSRDAVNRVQRLIKPVKVGHAGTLDPIATGVLVLCLGPATRLIEHVQRMEKRYVGAFLLGRRSPSDDVEIEPELLPHAPEPTLAEIQAALPSFTGELQQVPPAYSAIKIAGQKAYDLARAGKSPEMQPRPVKIHAIEVVRYEYPELVLDIRCGSGTYIRALGRDLAESLGTAAVMSALERTAIGRFTILDALPDDQVTAESLAANLRPPLDALADAPQRLVTPEEESELRFGRPIAAGENQPPEAAAVNAGGELVALLRLKRGEYWPWRVFAS
jgi:tRNA pseudouridine55 synthase